MKSNRWFCALVLSLCVLTFAFISGCGNATGGGSGGGASTTGRTGKLVDPYITDAIVYVD